MGGPETLGRTLGLGSTRGGARAPLHHQSRTQRTYVDASLDAIVECPSLFGTGDFFGTVPSFGWYSDRAPVLQESSTLLVLGASR